MAFSRILDFPNKQWRKPIPPRSAQENAEFLKKFSAISVSSAVKALKKTILGNTIVAIVIFVGPSSHQEYT
jgi:hypothetical protein